MTAASPSTRAAGAEAAGASPWWAGSVGYEVYLRSFADGDGDGVGDLHGLLAKLDYLEWLGVDIVWVTPFYPSPMRDHGYDVADYRGVAEEFGSLEVYERLADELHRRGMRLVIDLVPNHTSSEHEWFRRARSSRDDPYRDYYIWRDPAPDGGPPNNWLSHFGGPAWTFDDATGQYWLHLFLSEQPDLNWTNPAVREEFDEILRYWLERGADGFRIDVAHALVKHPDLPDLPVRSRATGGGSEQAAEEAAEAGLTDEFNALEHVYDVNQPGVLDIYRRWRAVVKPYQGLLLGEVYVLDIEHLAPYVREQDGLHLSFWFRPLHMGWSAAGVRQVLRHGAGVGPNAIGWVLSSHDRKRAVSRFGGGAAGRARALAFATLLAGLPGVPFVYQGEELGLEDGTIRPEEAQDPVALRAGAQDTSRDGCRTPMPWSPGPGLGFTTADRAWLPFGDRDDADTVAVQRSDPAATVHRYRRLIALRRGSDDLRGAPVRWLLEDGPVIAYRRGDTVVAANCGDEPAAFELPAGRWSCAFATRPAREDQRLGASVDLAPYEALIVRSPGDPAGTDARDGRLTTTGAHDGVTVEEAR